MTVTEQLRELEERLLDGSVRKDSSQVESLLADGFQEFGGSGRVFTKAEVLAELLSEESAAIVMTEFTVTLLADGAALLTYRAARAGVESLRSSVWVLEAGAWRMVFHQGTRLVGRRETTV